MQKIARSIFQNLARPISATRNVIRRALYGTTNTQQPVIPDIIQSTIDPPPPSFGPIAESWGCWSIDIRKSLKVSPELETVRSEQIDNVFRVLTESGFSSGQTLHICTVYPAVLQLHPDQLSSILNQWNLLEFNSEHISKIITANPPLISYPAAVFRKQINFLRDIFHQKVLHNQLEDCPNLITDSISSIKAKVIYIERDMRISLDTIVSNVVVFKHSLEHIRTRHLFLYRAGIYKVPNLKSSVPSKNPALIDIVCLELEDFLKKFNLTVEEYVVFEEILKEEDFDNDEESDDEDEYHSDKWNLV